MTLEELADTLPDGFHDAQISSVSIDYIKREAKLIIDLSVGDPSSEKEELRDAYREGELKLSGLLYWVIEPPDANYPYRESKQLWVDAGALGSASFKPSVKLPEPLPAGAFASWIFVQDWNSFMFIAAMDASLVWND
ncbi:MAG: hypothetical protein ND866_01395 [Pyrinomonadaceae bacterium]|nr:hypothetical protein [Pyrinomonadaceae bacterium]